jgi:hypothetical protein
MPPLSTNLHWKMYENGIKARKLVIRLKSAFKTLFSSGNIYGLEWGGSGNGASTWIC